MTQQIQTKFLAFSHSKSHNGLPGLAIETPDGFFGLTKSDQAYPGDLIDLIKAGPTALSDAASALRQGQHIDLSAVTILPPIQHPGKIICIGLNYVDHSEESGFVTPDYPTVFTRFSSSLIGQGAPLIRPQASTQFDFEGELVAIIGQSARYVSVENALDHVAGYSIFNDGSIRDFQFKTPQWTVGKNFDGTGAFGPVFVTADSLPPGCTGMTLQTRLNGKIVQSAPIDDMVFPVAELISTLSEVMTLEPGDVIVTGTPAGVGFARKPPLYMRDGDICEIEIDGIGCLRNPVQDEELAYV
ncbi:MAG: fumarylacetoacetate hydrolase [Hyphomicrobiales bacterium]|nr:MAG: fumarylacetoacetate hydrolase [Hyphomicrobiales bacterium]